MISENFEREEDICLDKRENVSVAIETIDEFCQFIDGFEE
jgi:hypothetical protein